MYTVRQGMFETNSSSSHVLVINTRELEDSELDPDILPGKVGWGSYGWEWVRYDTPSEKLEYLWTAILNLDSDIIDFWKERLEDVVGLPEGTDFDTDFSYTDCYIDHISDLRPFLERLKNSDSLLRKFILGNDSYILTGNDGGEEDEYFPDGFYPPDEDMDEGSFYDWYTSKDGSTVTFVK